MKNNLEEIFRGQKRKENEERIFKLKFFFREFFNVESSEISWFIDLSFRFFSSKNFQEKNIFLN